MTFALSQFVTSQAKIRAKNWANIAAKTDVSELVQIHSTPHRVIDFI